MTSPPVDTSGGDSGSQLFTLPVIGALAATGAVIFVALVIFIILLILCVRGRTCILFSTPMKRQASFRENPTYTSPGKGQLVAVLWYGVCVQMLVGL